MDTVFVVETETGNLSVLSGVSAVRGFVDEFWDILEQDFQLFDEKGRRLRFQEAFLLGDDHAYTAETADDSSLRSALATYSTDRGLEWRANEPLSKFVDVYRRSESH